MTNHKRTAEVILGKVIQGLTAEHGDCQYPLCTWRLAHKDDVAELAKALVAAGYTVVPLSEAPAVPPLEVTQDGTALWSSQQVAAYRGMAPGSVRKAMHRLGISESRGYPAAAVVAAWPVEEVSA